MELGVAAEVEFVDYGVLPGHAPAGRLSPPVEIRIDDNAFRHEGRAVALVEGGVVAGLELIAEYRRVPRQIAEMPTGVGVEHQLVPIEPVPDVGFVRAVHPVTVDRPRMHARQIAVPDLVGVFGQVDSR